MKIQIELDKKQPLRGVWQDCDFLVNSRLRSARIFILLANKRFRTSQITRS